MHKVLAKHILSTKNGMNIYRGCTHGCIYCDSRSLCYNMNHLFEDIEVKENAPILLEEELRRKRKKCMIGTGSMTDPYISLELELKNTRKCIEIVDKYGFGFTVHTKSNRIIRDIDLLKHINDRSKCVVQMTLTTYDEKLCKAIEPNVCTTKERFQVLKQLRDKGIPTIVWLSPILPFINDTEENINGILDYCIEAKVKGIICFGMGVTLRDGNREYFYKKLEENFPGMKQRYIQSYGNSYIITSANNDKLMSILKQRCIENGIMYDVDSIFKYLWTYEEKFEQVMFDI